MEGETKADDPLKRVSTVLWAIETELSNARGRAKKGDREGTTRKVRSALALLPALLRCLEIEKEERESIARKLVGEGAE